MTLWISTKLCLAIHDEQISQHGGASGVRDEGLIESALARPLNLAGYGAPSAAELGATYALGIARNHPFIDGNKRTAFACMTTFFDLNGVGFDPPDAEAVMTMLALAAGEIDDADFVAWVVRHASAHD
jgi:death on curing protein